MLQKSLDGGFIALEEAPLPYFFGGNQVRLLQGGQVSRDGRLRQFQAPVDQAGTNADIKRIVLRTEMLRWIFQPLQYLPPYRIGQRLVDGVNVHCLPRSVFARRRY